MVFRSPGAVAIWYLWLVFAAANLVDLAVRGHDHTSAVLASVLLLITGMAYAAALRPRIIADEQAVTVRNPLRDVRVPWGAVTSVELKEFVRVHYLAEPADPDAPASPRVVSGWAMHASNRTLMKAEYRRARAARQAERDSGLASHHTRMKAEYRPARAARQAESDSGLAYGTHPGYGRGVHEARELTQQPAAVTAAGQLEAWRERAAGRGVPGGDAVVGWALAPIAALLGPAVVVAVVAVIH